MQDSFLILAEHLPKPIGIHANNGTLRLRAFAPIQLEGNQIVSTYFLHSQKIS
jgi:hypothetical protein